MFFLLKPSLSLAAALLLAATAAQAQTSIGRATSVAGQPPMGANRPAEHQAAAQTQRLAAEIGLSPEQQTKVRQIILASRLEMAAATQQAHQGGDPTALRPALKAARDKADAQLRTVLTPAQFAKYQQIVAARLGQLRMTSQTD